MAKQSNVKTKPAANKAPVQKFRSQNISVAIWEHVNDEGVVNYSCTMQKSYKDDKEEWQNTDTMFASDLPHARKALDMAHTWIIEKYMEDQDNG